MNAEDFDAKFQRAQEFVTAGVAAFNEAHKTPLSRCLPLGGSSEDYMIPHMPGFRFGLMLECDAGQLTCMDCHLSVNERNWPGEFEEIVAALGWWDRMRGHH